MKSNRFAHFLFGLMVVLPVILPSQNVIEGRILDSDSNEPLVAATVQVGVEVATTDLEGQFVVAYQVGDSLRATYIGYQTQVLNISATVGNLEILMVKSQSLLQEVTVTSSKYERALGETTATIEVLPASLIESNNTTSIEQVLDKVPGVNVIDGQANIRGGSGYSYGAGSRVMLLLDDIPVLQVDAGFPNWGDYPIESVKQIEVVKGSASAIYGSSAINGIINMRTKYATATPQTTASVFYTHHLNPADLSRKWWDRAPYEAGASFSDARRIGKLDLVTGGYYRTFESFRKDDYTRYGRLNTKLHYRLSNNWQLGTSINFNKGSGRSMFFWRDGGEGAYLGTEDNLNISERTRYTIDPYIRYQNEKGGRHEFKGRYFSINNENNANRSNRSNTYYGEYQFLQRFTAAKVILTAGLVGSKTDVTAELYGDTTLIATNWAAYLQLEKKFAKRFTLDLGARLESNFIDGPSVVNGDLVPDDEVRESKPVFRAGLNYQAAEYTFLRSSWGQGYRYPTIAERYISTVFGPLRVSANPLVRSETGWTSEVGIKQGLKLGGISGILDFSAYWSEYQDMMEFVLTGLVDGFQSQNVGNTRIKGFDISLGGQGNAFGGESRIIGGYTYIDPKFQEFTEADRESSSVDFNILKYRSRHLVKLDWENTWKKFSVAFSIQHTSRMVAVDQIFNIFIPGLADFRTSHRDFTLVDLRFRYSLRDSIDIGLLLKNLFNEEYSVRPGLLEAPRNITMRLEFDL